MPSSAPNKPAPINPFASNAHQVGDAFYKAKSHPTVVLRKTAKIGSRTPSIRWILSLCGLLCFFPAVFLWGAVNVQTRCRVGLSICHTMRFLCQVPDIFIPFNLGPVCDAATRMHWQFGSSNAASQCMDENGLHVAFVTAKPEMLTEQTSAPYRNYALAEDGAYILKEFTSPTYGLSKPSFFASTVRLISGYVIHDMDVPRPNWLLEENIVDGECWEASATNARVGIQLAEKIHISYISVNYIHAQQLSPLAASRTPQDISIWGLIEEGLLSQLPNETEIRDIHYFMQQGVSVNLPVRFVLLAQIRYDASSPVPRQLFPVPLHLQNISSVRTILADFETNKGGNTTCIYTLGVHGIPAP